MKIYDPLPPVNINSPTRVLYLMPAIFASFESFYSCLISVPMEMMEELLESIKLEAVCSYTLWFQVEYLLSFCHSASRGSSHTATACKRPPLLGVA